MYVFRPLHFIALHKFFIPTSNKINLEPST